MLTTTARRPARRTARTSITFAILLTAAIGVGTPGVAAAAPTTPTAPGTSAGPLVITDAPVDGDLALRQRATLGGVRTAARTPVIVHKPMSDVAKKAIWGTTQHVTYLWGGGHGGTPPEHPDRTDCSGYSRWAYWTTLGYDISGDSSEGMRTSGQFTKVSDPQPGDAVFFGKGGRGPSYHMAIYIGRNAQGDRMIAENSSTTVEAHLSSLETNYRLTNLLGFYRLTAVRFVNPLTPTRITGQSVPAAAKAGTPTVISGLLWSAKDQKPIGSAEVLLTEQYADGTWRTLQRTTTASNGKYSFKTVANGTLRRYVAQYTGSKYPFQTMRSAVFYQRGASS